MPHPTENANKWKKLLPDPSNHNETNIMSIIQQLGYVSPNEKEAKKKQHQILALPGESRAISQTER
jgi:hypothetical protein